MLNRFSRNKIIIGIFIFTMIISLFLDITPQKFCNFSNLMDGCLSFSSIATALLFGSFSIIPSSNSNIVKKLKALGSDLKLMDRLLISTIIFFSVSILSLIELLFSINTTNTFSRFITSLWFAGIISGIFEIFYIVYILIHIIESMSRDR